MLWKIRVSDASGSALEQRIEEAVRQFGSDRIESLECVRTDGLAALKASVTTSRIADWYGQLVFIESGGALFATGNGAVRDEWFELFHRSFRPALDE